MTRIALVAAVAGCALLIGCQNSGHRHDEAAMGDTGYSRASRQATGAEHMHHAAMAAGETPDMARPVTKAIAVMHPTQGNQAHGTVRFEQQGDEAVRVVIDLSGLAPNSTHGIHIHEFGDCSAPDASSAGGHYNPGGHQHGGPEAQNHHAGDLGNVQANEQGNAHAEMTINGVTVGAHPNPILGRSVILHAKADDLKSQPSGESGARIACGVIGAAK